MRIFVLGRTAIFIGVSLLSFKANSWNAGGHMSTGAIAYKYLSQHSAATIGKTITLLKKHPDFNKKWKAHFDALPATKRDMFLFMVAARWPDDVRKTWRDRPDWHFYDSPLTFTTSHTKPAKSDNAIVEIGNNLKVVTSTAADSTRAIALCWVFHLMGGLHQPLHNVTLFSPVFPNGDRGGNYFLIKDQTKELHAYWDDDFLTTKEVSYDDKNWYSNVDNATTSVMSSHSTITFDKSADLDAKHISENGVAIAKKSVYKHNTKLLKPGVEGGAAPSALPDGYVAEAKKIVSAQVTTAGMKLAVLLSKNI